MLKMKRLNKAMNKVAHLLTNFCWLNLTAISVYHYKDTSWRKKGETGAPSTNITWQCTNCKHTYRESYYAVGYLELEQINNTSVE